MFINTELYARVSVAVLFHKLADLADMTGLSNEYGTRYDAVESGKLFLLELLDSVVWVLWIFVILEYALCICVFFYIYVYIYP